MDKNKNNWQAGVKVFIDISGWIVGPIIIALFAGQALDKHFDTGPFLFLGLTFFAFIITIVGIVRVVQKYKKKIENHGK